MIDPISPVLGFSVRATKLDHAVASVLERATDDGHAYAVLFNTHMCSEAHRDPQLRAAVGGAEWIFADGRPIYWLQRLAGAASAHQVRGADLMWALLGAAEHKSVPVGFFGGSQQALTLLRQRLAQAFPTLDVRLMLSPPHGNWPDSSDAEHRQTITSAGVKILFVALGCPRQELWMMRQTSQIDAVMIGVGAAVDFCAGVKAQAPRLMQRLGLEWLHRLGSEPGRLWRRYLFHNLHFIALLVYPPLRRHRR